MANNQMPLEQVEDLGTQRFQGNVSRKFNQLANPSSGFTGCVGGTQTNLGNNSYKIQHALGKEPKGFVITSQATTSSIKCQMLNPTGTEVTLTFDADPGAFKVFLY